MSPNFSKKKGSLFSSFLSKKTERQLEGKYRENQNKNKRKTERTQRRKKTESARRQRALTLLQRGQHGIVHGSGLFVQAQIIEHHDRRVDQAARVG